MSALQTLRDYLNSPLWADRAKANAALLELETEREELLAWRDFGRSYVEIRAILDLPQESA